MSDIHPTSAGGTDPDRTVIVPSTHVNAGSHLPAGHALPGTTPLPGDSTIHVTGDTPGTSNDADATRAEIEQTRARMSETIDTIEEALLRKKGQIEEKLDVKAQVRERLAPVTSRVNRQPLAVFGGVFGAGLVLGYITGDSDDKPKRSKAAAGLTGEAGAAYGTEWRERSRRWEEQARRLMKQNQEQEEELHRLRSRVDESARRPASRAAASHDDADSEGGSDWRGSLFGAISGVFGGLMSQVRGGGDEAEYEVTLDDDHSGANHDDAYSPSRSYESQAYSRRGYGQAGGYDSSEYGSGDYPQHGFQQGGRPYDDGLGGGARGYGSDERGFGPRTGGGEPGYGGTGGGYAR